MVAALKGGRYVERFVKTSTDESAKSSLCVLTDFNSEIVLDSITRMPLPRAIKILQAIEVLIEKRLGIEDRNITSEILS